MIPLKHTLSRVTNRGTPPESFIRELGDWGRRAPDEIFARNDNPADVYASTVHELGPWAQGAPGDLLSRRAAMLEILRVLAGFESSWRWEQGEDTANASENSADTRSAGAWQISANSLVQGEDLRRLAARYAVASRGDGEAFQRVMKWHHLFAIEYAARLLRHTIHHNGPVLRREINPWLRRASALEFQQLLKA